MNYLVLGLPLAVISWAHGAVIKGGIEVPTYMEPCVRDQNFDRCMKRALQALIPKLGRKGIPELGLDSIDPLYIPEMLFNYDSLPDIGGKMEVVNSVATGLSNIKILKVESNIVDGKSFAMDIHFVIPRVEIRGNFKMDGRVGDFPVNGNGPYNITTGKIRGAWKLRGVPVQDEGEDHFKLIYFGMRPSVGYFKVHADNVVNGNPKLSSLIVAFTNRFWQLLYNQSLPHFEKNFDELGKDILNKIFLQIPINQLFPPAPEA